MELGDVLFILYVRDQRRSRDFYALVLDRAPTLDVAGMTEFSLGSGRALGLMPEAGIARLLDLDERTWPPGAAPRCEVYLRTPDATTTIDRAVRAGADMVSPMAARDWGEQVAYVVDPDGHVLAIAQVAGDPAAQSGV